MRSQTSILLAILEGHFGDIVKEVGGALLAFEKPVLPQIFHSLVANGYATIENASVCQTKSKISISNIRQALLILHQHNCLIYELPVEALANTGVVEGPPKKIILNEETLKLKGFRYSLNVDMVINRLRIPKYVHHIKKSFGLLHSFIFEEIIHHGRLQTKAITKIIHAQIFAYRFRKSNTTTAANPSSSSSTTVVLNDDDFDAMKVLANESDEDIHKIIWTAFEKLVENRMIVTIASSSARMNEEISLASRGGSATANSTTNSNSSTGNKSSKSAAAKTATATVSKPKPAPKRSRKSPSPVVALDELPAELAFLETQQSDHADEENKEGDDDNDDEDADYDGPHTKATKLNSGKSKAIPKRALKKPSTSSSSSSSSSEGETTSLPLSAANIKQERDSLAIDPNGPLQHVYWTVGWDRFFLDQRYALCTRLVRERMGLIAGDVVKLMFEISLEQSSHNTVAAGFNKSHGFSGSNGGGSAGGDDISARISSIDLFREIQSRKQKKKNHNTSVTAADSSSSYGGMNMYNLDLTQLGQLLEVMRLDALKLLIKETDTSASASFMDAETSTTYAVNVRGLINHLQHRTLHSIVSERYSEASGRITQLLQQRKYLEQQKVGDMIIVPPRDTREKLYSLYKEGWVDVLEVSKKADFNPASTQYFWHAEERKMIDTALDLLYKSMLNLKIRRESEYDQGFSQVEYSIMSAIEKEKHARSVKVLCRLDYTGMKLDDTLILFTRI